MTLMTPCHFIDSCKGLAVILSRSRAKKLNRRDPSSLRFLRMTAGEMKTRDDMAKGGV